MSDIVLLVLYAAFLLALLGLIAWGAYRAYTPAGRRFYAGMCACMVLAVVAAVHSTWPSSAPRVKATGIIAWTQEHGAGRSITYTLGLLLPSGAVLPFRGAASVPFFAEGRDHVTVTYLDEKVHGDYPRAIAFDVQDGPRAGWRSSVSADWLGPWLVVVFGAGAGLYCIFQANARKRAKADVAEVPV